MRDGNDVMTVVDRSSESIKLEMFLAVNFKKKYDAAELKT